MLLNIFVSCTNITKKQQIKECIIRTCIDIAFYEMWGGWGPLNNVPAGTDI